MQNQFQPLEEFQETPRAVRFSFSDKFQYYYERFITRRSSFIFLNLLVIFLFAYLLLLSLHLVFYQSSWQASLQGESLQWHVFLEMLTPARLGVLRAPPWSLLLLSVITTFVGFGFYSLLIAYVSAKTQETVNLFRSGLGPVIEHKHTLILGFDNRIPRLIQELNYSNHTKQKHPVVIMFDLEKSLMDQQLSSEIERYNRVRVNLASGEPSRLNSLHRINAVDAKSAIVLARCSHTASISEREASDVRVIQTVKALYKAQKPNHRYPIVAEIFDPKIREMISALDEVIITYDSYELIASILVQSAIFPGIERVYNELFSFEMSEFYFYPNVPEGSRFGDLICHFEDGVPVGVQHSNKQITMLPSVDYVFNQGDEVLLIARDDQYIKYSSDCLYQSTTYYSLEHPRVFPSQEVLLIGWHYLAPSIIKECCRRLPLGSTLTIVTPESSEEIMKVISDIENTDRFKIIHEYRDPFIFDELEYIDPFSFDTVILLSRGDHIGSEEKMDADTLMLVLLLRRLRDKQIGRQISTRIVTQLFRPENEQLIDNHSPEIDDPVDFVLTSKTSTMLFTQLSEEGDMVQTYELLFGDCTYEIALCPITDYVKLGEHSLCFIDLYMSALCRGEICIGFKSDMLEIQAAPYSGMYINPPKDHAFPFCEGDQLVLLRLNQDNNCTT